MEVKHINWKWGEMVLLHPESTQQLKKDPELWISLPLELGLEKSTMSLLTHLLKIHSFSFTHPVQGSGFKAAGA